VSETHRWLLVAAVLSICVGAVSAAPNEPPPPSVDHIRRDAQAGDADAMFNLVTACVEGSGTKRNLNEAMHWYKEAIGARLIRDKGFCAQDLLFPPPLGPTGASYERARTALVKAGVDEPRLCASCVRIPDVNLKEEKLSDVIEFFESATGWDLVVTWPALDRAKIHRDLRVSLDLKKASFADAMDAALKTAGNKAAWGIVDGLIIVSTSDDLAQQIRLHQAYKTRFATPKNKGEKELFERLTKEWPVVVFNEIEMADTLDFFRDLTRIHIKVDWAGLGRTGVTRKTKIQLRTGKLPRYRALELVLANTGATIPLVFQITGGKLFIATEKNDQEATPPSQ
jgi:hypothetical protein